MTRRNVSENANCLSLCQQFLIISSQYPQNRFTSYHLKCHSARGAMGVFSSKGHHAGIYTKALVKVELL